jgi:general secretion pathway protein G
MNVKILYTLSLYSGVILLILGLFGGVPYCLIAVGVLFIIVIILGPFKGDDKRSTSRKIFGIVCEISILLIIILILVAIALPSNLDYHNRGKVNQIKKDFKSIENALETYRESHGSYPRMNIAILTTPIAYMERLNKDPFFMSNPPMYPYYSDGTRWIIIGSGPDRDYDINPQQYINAAYSNTVPLIHLTYDATNGTSSNGDVWNANF